MRKSVVTIFLFLILEIVGCFNKTSLSENEATDIANKRLHKFLVEVKIPNGAFTQKSIFFDKKSNLWLINFESKIKEYSDIAIIVDANGDSEISLKN